MRGRMGIDAISFINGYTRTRESIDIYIYTFTVATVDGGRPRQILRNARDAAKFIRNSNKRFITSPKPLISQVAALHTRHSLFAKCKFPDARSNARHYVK